MARPDDPRSVHPRSCPSRGRLSLPINKLERYNPPRYQSASNSRDRGPRNRPSISYRRLATSRMLHLSLHDSDRLYGKVRPYGTILYRVQDSITSRLSPQVVERGTTNCPPSRPLPRVEQRHDSSSTRSRYPSRSSCVDGIGEKECDSSKAP